MDWVSRSIELRERSFTLSSISPIRSSDFCMRSPAPTVPLFPSFDGLVGLFDGSEDAARIDLEDDGFLVWHLRCSLDADDARLTQTPPAQPH